MSFRAALRLEGMAGALFEGIHLDSALFLNPPVKALWAQRRTGTCAEAPVPLPTPCRVTPLWVFSR